VEVVLDVHAQGVKKIFLDLVIVTMYLLQKIFIEQYLCWYTHEKSYVPHETMIERMVGSTSSASNVHEVVNDNSNHCRTMVMDAMRINQDHTDQCPIIDEEPNVDVTKFFFIF
jgi:hypothetical protein